MKNIALKLWLGMMALVSVMLILLWLFQIVFLGKFYTQIRISDIKKEGLAIVKELNEGNNIEFEKRTDEFTHNNNAYVELIDLDSNILYESNTSNMQGQKKTKIRNQVYNQALKGEIESATMSHPRFGTQSMLIGLPVYILGELEGAFLIEFPLVAVENTVDILKRQLFYMIAILLFASLILSFILSKSFTKPILDIIKVSEEMAKGNLNSRVEVSSQDEIGKLAKTINNMGLGLTKTDQLRKDLIANVSHELRTPLSLIKGYAETIRDISGDHPKKREKHIQIMIEESDRLSRIVDDILNLSQLQAGYIQINKSPFMLNELLEYVIGKYEIEKGKKEVTICLEKEEDVLVEADEEKIEQVLYNFINNALNHSNPGGIITISALSKEDVVRVQIINTGKGIPEDEIKYIWDRFYKIDKSGQRNIAGTGIGLAIVKSILEAHEFDYGAESQLGTNTTFWFEIKIAK